jgi:hypothetical protein
MLTIPELEEMTKKVNRHIDALWADSGFTSEPPKVTEGICRIIIAEYDTILRRKKRLEGIAEQLSIHKMKD